MVKVLYVMKNNTKNSIIHDVFTKSFFNGIGMVLWNHWNHIIYNKLYFNETMLNFNISDTFILF